MCARLFENRQQQFLSAIFIDYWKRLKKWRMKQWSATYFTVGTKKHLTHPHPHNSGLSRRCPLIFSPPHPTATAASSSLVFEQPKLKLFAIGVHLHRWQIVQVHQRRRRRRRRRRRHDEPATHSSISPLRSIGCCCAAKENKEPTFYFFLLIFIYCKSYFQVLFFFVKQKRHKNSTAVYLRSFFAANHLR